jgi:hypothetical protein
MRFTGFLLPYNPNMTYNLHNNNPINTNYFIKDYSDNRCRIFNPLIDIMYGFSAESETWNFELLFIITLDNSSIYDYFEINFGSIITDTDYLKLSGKPSQITENITLNPNQHFIVREQYVICEFAIKRNIYYSSPFYGILGFKPDNSATSIEIDETVLASIQNTSFTVLELRFKSPFIRNEEERYQTTSKLIKLILNIYYINFNTIFF